MATNRADDTTVCFYDSLCGSVNLRGKHGIVVLLKTVYGLVYCILGALMVMNL